MLKQLVKSSEGCEFIKQQFTAAYNASQTLTFGEFVALFAYEYGTKLRDEMRNSLRTCYTLGIKQNETRLNEILAQIAVG